jgi:hypothetical protein
MGFCVYKYMSLLFPPPPPQELLLHLFEFFVRFTMYFSKDMIMDCYMDGIWWWLYEYCMYVVNVMLREALFTYMTFVLFWYYLLASISYDYFTGAYIVKEKYFSFAFYCYCSVFIFTGKAYTKKNVLFCCK